MSLTTHVPADAVAEQEKAPAGAAVHATRDGEAAVPVAAQFVEVPSWAAMQSDGLPEHDAPPPTAIGSEVATVVPLSVMLEADAQAPAPPPLISVFAAIVAEDDSCVPEVKQGIPPEFTVPLTVNGKEEEPPLLLLPAFAC